MCLHVLKHFPWYFYGCKNMGFNSLINRYKEHSYKLDPRLKDHYFFAPPVSLEQYILLLCGHYSSDFLIIGIFPPDIIHFCPIRLEKSHIWKITRNNWNVETCFEMCLLGLYYLPSTHCFFYLGRSCVRQQEQFFPKSFSVILCVWYGKCHTR